MKQESINFIKDLAFIIILAICIRSFLFSTSIVDGKSMYPTLDHGDKLIQTSYPYTYNKLERGDIIIFHSNTDQMYIKRIIGLEGDQLSFSHGYLCINGEETSIGEEIFHSFSGQRIFDELEIPKDHIYVLGDNYYNSRDSRSFGPIDKKEIKGKAVIRVFPFEAMGFLNEK